MMLSVCLHSACMMRACCLLSALKVMCGFVMNCKFDNFLGGLRVESSPNARKDKISHVSRSSNARKDKISHVCASHSWRRLVCTLIFSSTSGLGNAKKQALWLLGWLPWGNWLSVPDWMMSVNDEWFFVGFVGWFQGESSARIWSDLQIL